jgi:hypothetical protein
LVADSHIILVTWRNHFSQLLNVHGINDVRQTEINSAESIVPEPNASEVKMVTEKLKRHTSSSSEQIPKK